MTSQQNALADIREAWTEEERSQRRELAQAMQLQLRSLIVLSELQRPESEHENDTLSVASAC